MSAIDEQSRPSLAVGVRLQTDATTGEPILLFPEGLMHLNSTAQEVLARCDGNTTVAALITALAAEYETDSSALRIDVIDCLTELRQRKMIVFKP
jgi:pyrroloquinoline quinone biosynthesis protein D